MDFDGEMIASIFVSVLFGAYFLFGELGRAEVPEEYSYLTVYRNMFNILMALLILYVLYSAFTSNDTGLGTEEIYGVSTVISLFLIYMVIIMIV